MIRQTKGSIACLALMLCLGSIAWSEDGALPYTISSVDIEVEGSTRKSAIAGMLDIKVGERFADIDTLEAYIATKTKTLVNNRIMDPSSTVEYSISDNPERQSEAIDVDVKVMVKDTWAILALPYPKYSDADGFSLALRYKDNNFLGTLTPLTLNVNYYSRSGNIDVGIDGTYPFSIAGIGAAWAVDATAIYEGGGEFTAEVNSSLSSKIDWSWMGLPWFFAPYASYQYEHLYDRHTAQAKASVGFDFGEALKFSVADSLLYKSVITGTASQSLREGLGISTRLELGRIPLAGEATWVPSAELYSTLGIPSADLTDAGLALSNALSASDISWVGNLRKGVSFSLNGSYVHHFIASSPEERNTFSFSLDSSAFAAICKVLGVNSRLTARWYASWSLFGIADSDPLDWEPYLRGRKAALEGDIGTVLNLETPINFAQGRFFGLGFLESEIFIDPFLDVGYVRMDQESDIADPKNFLACGGAELVLFPMKARSFSYRVSAGYDLGDLYATKDLSLSKLELSMGLGLLF